MRNKNDDVFFLIKQARGPLFGKQRHWVVARREKERKKLFLSFFDILGRILS